MPKYTRGPWWWDEWTESIGSPAGWIAACGESTHEQESDVPHGDVEANARLIAAAPELLEACELALELSKHCLMRLQEKEAWNIEILPEWHEANDTIADAIAKATGKSEGEEQ